jgi:hypothetical protein
VWARDYPWLLKPTLNTVQAMAALSARLSSKHLLRTWRANKFFIEMDAMGVLQKTHRSSKTAAIAPTVRATIFSNVGRF